MADGIGLLIGDVKGRISGLESIRDSYYSDNNVGQFYNALVELKKKNFKIENETLITIMQYPDEESIINEIQNLKRCLQILQKTLKE